MFEQLDAQGLLVLSEAERAAHRLAHHYIGTEHLLVGLAAVPGGSRRALTTCGLSAADLEREVAEMLGRGRAPISVRPPLTSTAELVLERARWLARQRGRGGTTDVDLLLAVLQLKDSTAATVLRRLGVDPASIEDHLGRVGSSEAVEGPPATEDGAAPGTVTGSATDPATAEEASRTGPLGVAGQGAVEPGAGPAAGAGAASASGGRERGPASLEALVEDLIALRREVLLLRAEVARLSLLLEGR